MAPRHPIAYANERSPFGDLTPAEFYARHGVTHATSSFTNPEGLRIFTQWWAPEDRPPLGIICIIHGFMSESSWFLQLTAVFLAESGFAVCALDHRGHGNSDGLYYHIPDVNPVVDDCLEFFDSFRRRYDQSLPTFMYGERLGGSIALLIHLRGGGRRWDGVVLSGVMCGISDKFKPPWPLEHFLGMAAKLMPTWQVVPTKGSIPALSLKVEWKRKLELASPWRKVSRPRASTTLELLRLCREVQDRVKEVTIPMLIVQGGDDVVCDPACVEELYKKAKSEDKTLKIYPGMWHHIVGEPDENVDLVFGDILNWLMTRAERARAIAREIDH